MAGVGICDHNFLSASISKIFETKYRLPSKRSTNRTFSSSGLLVRRLLLAMGSPSVFHEYSYELIFLILFVKDCPPIEAADLRAVSSSVRQRIPASRAGCPSTSGPA